ncbi:hypothetical protein C8J56DRAFT_1059732 [Mycena floridula]|nr:hypothetical protein C8J56DRAFT_1059732 [Mycena floridula]
MPSKNPNLEDYAPGLGGDGIRELSKTLEMAVLDAMRYTATFNQSLELDIKNLQAQIQDREAEIRALRELITAVENQNFSGFFSLVEDVHHQLKEAHIIEHELRLMVNQHCLEDRARDTRAKRAESRRRAKRMKSRLEKHLQRKNNRV